MGAKAEYLKQLDGNIFNIENGFGIRINVSIDVAVLKQDLLSTKADYVKQLDGNL
jgi:hypothetical protein